MWNQRLYMHLCVCVWVSFTHSIAPMCVYTKYVCKCGTWLVTFLQLINLITTVYWSTCSINQLNVLVKLHSISMRLHGGLVMKPLVWDESFKFLFPCVQSSWASFSHSSTVQFVPFCFALWDGKGTGRDSLGLGLMEEEGGKDGKASQSGENLASI